MIGITQIRQKDDRTLHIHWSDTTESLIDVVELRRRCPCAVCVDEWTRKPLLKPDQVSDKVRPKTVESVGQYALKIAFSDSHSTGIYTYNFLRELGAPSQKFPQ